MMHGDDMGLWRHYEYSTHKLAHKRALTISLFVAGKRRSPTIVSQPIEELVCYESSTICIY